VGASRISGASRPRGPHRCPRPPGGLGGTGDHAQDLPARGQARHRRAPARSGRSAIRRPPGGPGGSARNRIAIRESQHVGGRRYARGGGRDSAPHLAHPARQIFGTGDTALATERAAGRAEWTHRHAASAEDRHDAIIGGVTVCPAHPGTLALLRDLQPVIVSTRRRSWMHGWCGIEGHQRVAAVVDSEPRGARRSDPRGDGEMLPGWRPRPRRKLECPAPALPCSISS